MYREAEGKHMSRFGYRLAVKNAGRPHLVVIRCPDDKRRFMCIMDGTSYDLSSPRVATRGYEEPFAAMWFGSARKSAKGKANCHSSWGDP